MLTLDVNSLWSQCNFGFFENISFTHFFGLWKLEMKALDRIFKEIQVEALSIFGIKIYF
jgi:hypothetical protein